MIHFIIYLKWCFLIGINVIVSTFFASEIMTTTGGALGVYLGIMTFVFLYARIDIYLMNRKREKWRKALYIGVAIKSLFQLFPIIDLTTGLMATEMVNNLLEHDVLTDDHVIFMEIYLITVIDGLILSLFVAIITLSTRILYSHEL